MSDPAPLPIEEVERTLAPFGEARMLPRAAYVDADVLVWERRHLFEGMWVCAGRADAVAAPGQQHAVTVGTTGVLLVRDASGELRAFAHICRHRGHELLACGASATRGVLQCPYHAWTYDLDGTLRHAPHAGELQAVVNGALDLLPVAAEVWAGWVFVNVDGAAAPLAEQLGDLPMITANWECERLVVAATHHYDLAANWKVAIENYHECYHCPLIHPELSRVSPPASGLNIDGAPGAFVGGSLDLAAGAVTMSLDGTSCGVPLPGLDDEERRRVLYLNVFPNLLVSLHPDYVMTHRIEPRAPDRTRIECQWLFDPDAVADPDFDPGYAVDFWDLTNRQDWAAVESVQRGLSSPRFVPGVFTAPEDAVYHFATMVAATYLGHPPVRTPSGSARGRRT